MKLLTCDYDRLDALSSLTVTDEMDRRRALRRAEHRREKRIRRAGDLIFVAVVVACAFVIGYCTGAM